MPKRKCAVEASAEDSELSPPPDGLLEKAQVGAKKKRKLKKEREEVVEAHVQLNGTAGPASARKSTTRKAKVKVEEGDEAEATPRKSKKRNRKEKTKVDIEIDDEAAEKKTKRKRKTKEEKAAEAMPLAPRTTGHKLFIGAHVSSAGGVQNSISNSVRIGANAFALFLKSQRKWANPALADEQCNAFLDNCKTHTYNQSTHVVPHGSYLVNLAHTDKARSDQAYESFLDDLKRCERLGIKLYNFHPGVANSTGGDRQPAIAHLASNINRAHKETTTVVTLLENMAHRGNVIGSTFEDLRDTIALIHNKDRIGVCFDTCHGFAGGYDLRAPVAFKATMDQFEEVVGFKYLRALHMNDSKAPFASHRDLHANIGTGFLGLRAFHNIVNDARLEGLPLILETPIEAKDADGTPIKDDKGKVKEDKRVWAREIKLLESLVGMDPESEEFLKLEKDLARKGEPERKRLSDQLDRKREKDSKKKAEKGGKKKTTNDEVVDEDDEDDVSSLSDVDDEAEVNGIGDTQRLDV